MTSKICDSLSFQKWFDVINYFTYRRMVCGSIRLATPQFQTKPQNCIRMGISIFKFSFGEVYRRIYVRKSLFRTRLASHRNPNSDPICDDIHCSSPNENFELLSHKSSRPPHKIIFRPYGHFWAKRRNRNEDLSSMLSFESSHLSSTTSVEEVICRLRHQFLRHLVSSWACTSVIKRTFVSKLYINAGE